MVYDNQKEASWPQAAVYDNQKEASWPQAAVKIATHVSAHKICRGFS